MAGFFHRLFHPHCEHCRDEKVCKTCEVLTTQLEITQHQNKELTHTIERMANPQPIEETTPAEEPKPLLPRIIPWNTRRNLLEAEDRKAAELQRKAEADTKNNVGELEKEVGVS